MATASVVDVALELPPSQQLQPLLDAIYTRPPRDACEWLAIEADGMHGLVILSPQSKGGPLEHLAVLVSARGRGIGQKFGVCPASSYWPCGPCHGESHHPHRLLLLTFRLSALRPAG